MSEQEPVDRFYWQNGKCCAGCDHWRHFTAFSGECTKSAPMPAEQRLSLLGMHSCSLDIGAGHAVTPRGHVCGDFRDSFDWNTLPLGYRARIGVGHDHA